MQVKYFVLCAMTKFFISFRFLSLLKILIIDGTAEGVSFYDYKAKSANFFLQIGQISIC